MAKKTLIRILPILTLLLASLACNLGIDFNPPPIPSQRSAKTPRRQASL